MIGIQIQGQPPVKRLVQGHIYEIQVGDSKEILLFRGVKCRNGLQGAHFSHYTFNRVVCFKEKIGALWFYIPRRSINSYPIRELTSEKEFLKLVGAPHKYPLFEKVFSKGLSKLKVIYGRNCRSKNKIARVK